MPEMTPVAEITAAQKNSLHAVLFDIDDTITLHGRLPACAYGAIEKLQDAGYIAVPITGRPAGWCDHIARMWPVNGIIGENGAFYFRHDQKNNRMQRRFWQNKQIRRANREKLAQIAEAVYAEVPAASVAADQGYRETDLAIDICEDIPALSAAEIDRILAIFQHHGATAKLSSIHVNGWYGDYDKCTMALRFLQETCGYTSEQARREVVYVGDSPNDAPMFGYFPNSVGVANIHQFRDKLTATPRWVTGKPGGFGFAEFVEVLLAGLKPC